MFSLIAGSVTTYQGKPNSFDIIYLDPVTMLPINIETHTFDLEYANEHDIPRWLKKYDWLEYYGLKDMSP